MEQPLAYLNRLTHHDWLIGYDSREFHQKATELYLQLSQLSTPETSSKIILAERESVKFLASFIAACAANCQVFLCNPDWGEQEWHQVFNLVQPDIILGLETREGILRGRGAGSGEQGENILLTQHAAQLPLPLEAQLCPQGFTARIMIPTGGSSGQIKFAIHTWETLTASVQGFTEYFQIKQVNSYCVLPLYHVSGLMQFMRSFTTGGKLVIQPFKSLELSQISQINPTEFFISLVPTQLQRLLQNLELTTWLSQFNTVLLGGAPAWDELLEKAKFHNIRLAPTYGMTETASQIATLKPDDFLNGKINSGQILPHAQVTICNQQGEVLPANHIGNITIQTQSLSLGYYPQIVQKQNYLQVDDLGFLDEHGYLNIVGRNSDKIITGGENIYPIEIESAIRATQMVADVCVIGIPDKQWGQALTAIYIPKDTNTSISEIKTAISHQLSRFKIPKHWIPLNTLPRNPQGKINRQQLQQIAVLSIGA
ncbi:2-succinylbenzoate--CoA ligase [Anabaena sp. FACHB-709]|uniref:O-succinylbenzoyl-CoA synthetase n=2 Tax=Nostocaceae TaxID=1162 RepID=A0A1Z4KPW0_ANAVA|nr:MULTISPECIES: 2-succinylbenzoate--CoA ligase [Nostocaceae]BAY71004.1 O-succinylbenzoyl-CoA synthetase [Trichormus variabilis NIES-23]HBW29223.1 2-succinylbenzoate--CoA ligase [Nostoc sp. UBA8866]MBD2171807.1 2-succinylbenzoate--CoA ligase [Anabaena cylindrica FACHB-318]MBD2263385.1 2-succinylbenzoate--CoA ligase [Anabaena sp. FACHB-709]MBD2272929.1 2-succinylbenzoate--CoA ligase [Nostoc sp. PCC 7120 = FACHB-418]